MKKVLVLLLVVIIGVIGSSAYGQTGQQKRQMGLLDSEISKTEARISNLEKKFEKEKKMEVFELKKEIRDVQKNGNPSVSPNFDKSVNAVIEVKHLNAEIDSIESITESSEIIQKKNDLADLQLKRTEMI